MPRTKTAIAFVALISAVFLASACDSQPDDMREWTPADHDQPSNPAAQGQVSPRSGSNEMELVGLAWVKNCTPCHGMRGRGDGPQAQMLQVPDLTRDETQKKSAEELAAIITNGKNKMPAFGPTLPPNVIAGLTKIVLAKFTPPGSSPPPAPAPHGSSGGPKNAPPPKSSAQPR